MAGQRVPRADSVRNRQAILAAARLIFDQGDDLRFDDFAARAGVGVGTLYRHFPTRQSLALAVYRDELEALCDRAAHSTLPAGEALAQFIRQFVDYIVAHAPLARTLASFIGEESQAEGADRLERTVGELVQRAREAGRIRVDATPGAVLVVLHGIGSAIGRPEWEREAREVAELLISGLRLEGVPTTDGPGTDRP